MEVDNETQSVVDYAIADQEFAAIIPAVYQSLLVTKGTGAQTGFPLLSCDTLTYLSGDTTDFDPNPVYSLNVSNTSCSLIIPDGKVRAGKITIRLTGKIRMPGSQMVLKLYDYGASGISYSCDSLVLSTRESVASYASFGVKLVNGLCKTGPYSIKYKFDRIFTVYPAGDAAGSDAVVYMYGDGSGTNRQGKNFSTNTVQGTSLVKHKTCKYIDKGIMELTPEGFKTRMINFGDGNCDDEATFTVNENTVAFKLK